MDASNSHAPVRWRSRTAASLAFAAVAAGAFGAHALEATLEARATVEIWKTAVLYHLTHAIVLWFLAQNPNARITWWLFLAGIVLFSGSLYALALVRLPAIGPVTPLGGLCLLAAWLCLAINPRTPRN